MSSGLRSRNKNKRKDEHTKLQSTGKKKSAGRRQSIKESVGDDSDDSSEEEENRSASDDSDDSSAKNESSTKKRPRSSSNDSFKNSTPSVRRRNPRLGRSTATISTSSGKPQRKKAKTQDNEEKEESAEDGSMDVDDDAMTGENSSPQQGKRRRNTTASESHRSSQQQKAPKERAAEIQRKTSTPVTNPVVDVIEIGKRFNVSQTRSITKDIQTNLKKMYSDDERFDLPMLEVVKKLRLPTIAGEKAPVPLRGFLSLEQQNAFNELDKIKENKEKVNDKLDSLLKEWEQGKNDEAFRAGLIKKLDLGVAKDLEKTLAMSYKLLTLENLSQKTNLLKELLEEKPIKELIKTLNIKHFKEAIKAVKKWKQDPLAQELVKVDFPTGTNEKSQWDELVELIEKNGNSEEPEKWVPLYSLWKWSDGGFVDIEKSLSQPWESRNTLKGKTEKDFEKEHKQLLENALLLAAASLGASYLVDNGFHPQAMGIERTFSWEKDWPQRGLGEIVLNQAMASTSTGPTTTIGYSYPSNATIWHTVRVFHQPKTAAMIQPLGGKKYWWQREALFPTANATMVLDRRQLDRSTVGTTEVVIDASALKNLVVEDRAVDAEFLEIKQDSLAEDATLKLIVDKSSREAHAQNNLMLLARDVEEFDSQKIPEKWQDLYGQTRNNWWNALNLKFDRKAMMPSDFVKELHKTIEPNANAAGIFRDSDKRLQWAKLEKDISERTATLMRQYHNLFVERSIDLSDYEELKKLEEWVNKVKDTRTKLLATTPEMPNDEKWTSGGNLRGLKEAIEMAKKTKAETKYVDITENAWDMLNEYLKSQDKKMKSTHSVYYSSAEAWGGEEATFETVIDDYLKDIEARTDLQYRAYRTKMISQNHYIAWLQRTSAEIQQRLVAIHPFTDGNGRVSRAMMVKYLMLNLPREVQEKWHEYLPTGDTSPDIDLQMTTDEYADALFPETRDVLQPKNEEMDVDDDDSSVRSKD